MDVGWSVNSLSNLKLNPNPPPPGGALILPGFAWFEFSFIWLLARLKRHGEANLDESHLGFNARVSEIAKKRPRISQMRRI